MKNIIRLLLASCALLSIASAQVPAGNHVRGQLLVQHRKSVSRSNAVTVVTVQGATVKKEIRAVGVLVLQLPEHSMDSVKTALSRSGKFTFVEPNYIAEVTADPNDTDYPRQWHLPNVKAPAAWDSTTGAANAPVAIIDTGVDATHLDLGAKVMTGRNFLDDAPDPSDTRDVHGHGTATAGTAAAITNNTLGVAGVAWSNPIMPLVAADATGYATYANIADAIIYAADHGARVINISIAGSSYSYTLQSAVDYAWQKGTVVVAAAGNANTSAPYYPAACNHAVAVASINAANSKSSFSNYGSWISLAAPGESILTTARGGGYTYKSGTSFSSPIVAGVAALVLAANPALSPQELVDLLQSTADDLGDPGFDQYYGWGRVNADSATATAAGNQADTTAPAVAITNPKAGQTVSGVVSVSGSASDEVGVVKVALYANGQYVSEQKTGAFSFDFDTASVTDGALTLTVKAYDAANNTGQASVSVTVVNTPEPPADETAPVVTIQSPANGATVDGEVLIQGSADDDVGVVRMELHIDGVLAAASTSSSISYGWNSTADSHTIAVLAWDEAGNEGQRTITVTGAEAADTTPPAVVIQSPSDGATVGRVVKVGASATDSGGISKLQLLIDGKLVRSTTSSSISYRWKPAYGTHTIVAIAWDKAGNQAQHSITVTRPKTVTRVK